MSDPVLAVAQDFLHRFFSPCRILVAISGGSDSKGLLLAVKQALDGGGLEGFSVAACTVDHGLRPGSLREAEDVAAFSARIGIPHVIKRWMGEKPTSGIQAAAREARYALLSEAAVDLHAACIVTAHTADDQAETIAMRKARSVEQSAGLSGMADAVLYGRQVWILRPFLNVRRGAIRDYLSMQGESWFDDPSNANPAFERVRMRHALLQQSGIEALPAFPSPQRGEVAQRADEGMPPLAQRQPSPSSGPAGHLLPAGEKGKQAAGVVQSNGDFRAGGHWRSLRAGRMAELLGDVSVMEGLVARLEPALIDRVEEPDARDVILLLAAVIGGISHAPSRAVADRVAAFLGGGAPGRITASRTVFDRRRDALYLYREKRGLPAVTLTPGARAIWDARFVVENRSKQTLHLHATEDTGSTEARLFAAGVPQAIARRAAPAALSISHATPDHQDIATVVERHIPLYDTFLPRFDLTLADRMAVLFGRGRYLVSPVHDVLTEKTRV
ncbi:MULTISPECIES: tRNA lysidine(34) synthetase TilS [unclassified Rhizobium]|uniref:tRNA lysidine(34) synthetase TilS n=1 Tax=unclassified Rhizobium TaxID=2613769 RepID=UPI0006FFDE5A|nr:MULTISPECIES: tRNA lysidine(34) synthetase TilS [unclassified Rhizobium]KQV35138.1 hypothetical protein ASC86_13075 [Rhizobium sp. Root1212]KRD24943.1 hypothetical protein ASE37_13070 [Rhizobium sp. Root268]